MIGKYIHRVSECDSTNRIAWELGRAGDRHGLVVLTDFQLAGRGRMGRRWESPRGKDLLMSVYLRPPAPPDPLSLYTVTAAVAVADHLNEKYDLPARLRWPNDVVIRDRKIAGILAESREDASSLKDAVIGIGMNILSEEPDWPEEFRAHTTSLLLEKGSSSREEAIADLFQALSPWFERLFAGDTAAIQEAWVRLSSLLGRRVKLLTPKEEVTGTVQDLDIRDGIRLLDDGGNPRPFRSEEITRLLLL